jgi:hypothetical protein
MNVLANLYVAQQAMPVPYLVILAKTFRHKLFDVPFVFRKFAKK